MIDLNTLKETFKHRYGGGGMRLFSAPGRVNIIGEHTDYNDGFVLPVAIDKTTVVAARKRDDRMIRVYSSNTQNEYVIDLDHPGKPRRGIWLDYVEGVAQVLCGQGYELTGADMVLHSDIPDGAGLSSSAAIEISTGFALSSLADIDINRIALALAGQQAEHEYVGTMCGIMDQFIAALGEEGNALLIDCRLLRSTLIPVDTQDIVLVICDTRVKHNLASSEYNMRREECERGVELLQKSKPEIRALRDLDIDQFEQYADALPEVIRRRCRHVITENARTLSAAEALAAGDWKAIGELMAKSHQSLRDDYEVSCKELDVMVELANKVEGTIGARMTGGGFGGCTVNFVQRNALDDFIARVMQGYEKATRITPGIYPTEIKSGARELT